MQAFLKGLLELLKAIDIGAIVRAILVKSGIAGIWGWVAALVLGPVADQIEKVKDQAIDDAEGNLDMKKTDDQIKQAATDHAAEQKKAETDADFDKAADDSLK